LGIQALSTESCPVPDEAGCPLASALQERSRFETFLADLSATFLSVPADQVDSQIVAGLRQIVAFLGIDRSGFGELVTDKNKLVITHSFEVPGVPSTPRIYVEDHWPDYARKVQEGEPFRVPEDLPAEAGAERAYLARVGLKSQFTIPLKMAGAVVGALGFASFRAPLEWPEDLVLRLGLMGDIFNHSLARKHACEALQRANAQVRILRKDLASATRQLRAAVGQALAQKRQELARQQEASRDQAAPGLAEAPGAPGVPPRRRRHAQQADRRPPGRVLADREASPGSADAEARTQFFSGTGSFGREGTVSPAQPLNRR
jgi:hypothetical protein